MDKVIGFLILSPEKLLTELDKKIIHQSYSSHSGLARNLAHKKVIGGKCKNSGADARGALSITRNYQCAIETRHHNHIHFDHHNCPKALIIKDSSKKTTGNVRSIDRFRGMESFKLTCIAGSR